MSERVCPVWMGWWLASPIRKLFQNPDKILRPFIQPGMRILEPGSAMGFFTLSAAKLAGPQGKIICVDIQTGMLNRLKKRAHKAGFSERIETRLSSPGSLEINDLKEKVDFAFAIAMVHEVPNQENLFKEITGVLKPGAKFLLAEPRGHVTKQAFQQSLFYAQKHGLELLEQGQSYGGWKAILKKPDINAYLGRQN